MRSISIVIIFATVVSGVLAQGQPDAARIQLKIRKLNVLASVLYVAAHPDDENTRAIAYMANDKLAATAYLSMTRGDGGQNLIGPEIRDLLGLIRTQELLAARRIDGGQQFFTRANDFGFSKSAAETFKLWGKDTILSDVVRIYRMFQPDIILTRFPPDERAGHGQHTASAVLAQEAFDAAARTDFQPDRMRGLDTWQAKRLLTNIGRWWNPDLSENTPGVVTVNMGTYNALLGKSYSEIAAESRSQHKSQGFGSSGRRGDSPEFFEMAKGEKADKDLFEGINTTWTRLPGGEKVQPLVDKALKEFNPEKPEVSIPNLIAIRRQIDALPASVWKERKMKEVTQLIADCAGFFFEVTADQPWVTPGDPVTSTYEVVNRSGAPVKLLEIVAHELSMDTTMSLQLTNNKLFNLKTRKPLTAKQYSDPYWLREEHSQGLFKVRYPTMIGKPENGPAIEIHYVIDVMGERIMMSAPLIYKWTDPVKGELSRPFEIVPPVFVNWAQKVYIFKDNSPRTISLLVKSSSSRSLSGVVRPKLPEGWKSEPAEAAVMLQKRGDERKVDFTVYPASAEGSYDLMAEGVFDGKNFHHAVQTIVYDHIPFQTLLPVSQSTGVRLDVKKVGQVIGYIRGAGDEVPQALRDMGYEVWEMKDEEVTPVNLRKVDAVVLGVRALNTNERIRHYMPDLLQFVKDGGTMIVQYNTANDFEIDKDKFSPYPLNVSRDRVTEENSEVRFLKPDHPLLNYPNKITAKDFEGWVQERGLYFPDKWDPAYEALLSINDMGESPKNGSLLVAKYGNGHYVYTGLSFFRELPEGVAGAYKLFANLTSLGKSDKPQNQKVKPKK